MARRNDPDTPAMHNKWEFSGGKVEFDEHPQDTVVREIKEEVGLTVAVDTLVPYTVVRFYKTKKEHIKLIFFCYLCHPVKGKACPSNEEVSEVGWFTPEEIKVKQCLPLTKEVLTNVLKLDKC